VLSAGLPYALAEAQGQHQGGTDEPTMVAATDSPSWNSAVENDPRHAEGDQGEGMGSEREGVGSEHQRARGPGAGDRGPVDGSSVPPLGGGRDFEHSQRLESIGILAGGIAHDFNNLLTGILGQISLALALLPPDSPARPPINKAAGAAERAADMTRQLLAYAGKGQFQLSSVALNELIIENIGLLETMLPRRVDLKLELDPELPPIEADRGQIQQVLMNLVLNAAESIDDESGRVTVSTGIVDGSDLEGPFIGGSAPRPGLYVRLSVSDTGTGMSEQTLSHIFDPFFSTKGSGRGLGLSAALGTVHTHDGALKVESEVGLGTRFCVLLPAASAQAAVGVEHGEGQVGTRSPGAAAVLVIDDEPAVRESTHDMLVASDYEVITARGGVEGVAAYRERAAEIGVVLLDMQMPGMNGEQVFDELKRIDPSVRVILMSGYSESEATQRFLGRGLLGFLQKPYDYETLLSVVAEAMA